MTCGKIVENITDTINEDTITLIVRKGDEHNYQTSCSLSIINDGKKYSRYDNSYHNTKGWGADDSDLAGSQFRSCVYFLVKNYPHLKKNLELFLEKYSIKFYSGFNYD